MSMRHAAVLGLVLGTGAAAPSPAAEVPRQVTAVRVADGTVRIDGSLDEDVWRQAIPATGFVQRDPEEGRPARDTVEIFFAYDADALYVGARVVAEGGRKVQAPLGRRDDGALAEHLVISLDTYRDRRTAYSFGVTAAGARLDHYHFVDLQADPDRGFDPVWDARTVRSEEGWTAEMRIPFAQLRFNAMAQHVWGVNVQHWVPSRHEDAYWVHVPKKEPGWASRFGDLLGLAEIRPSRRIEVRPYATAGSTLTGDRDPGNPFDDGRNLDGRLGGDLKMGIGPNLTLEATANPDFGQVEADPAEVNLSAFETFFTERRPFFTEGGALLRGRGANYFYSRRIGAAPRLSASGDYVDAPRTASILGAAKLTGRMLSGLSVGVLAAVTDRESARTFELDTRALTLVPVAPPTAYAIARVQQEFGASSSTVGVMITGVRRDLPAGDPMAAFLTRSAATAAVDWNIRFKGGAYELSGHAGLSRVAGEPLALLGVQRSSTHYFQRPDADYVEADPTRRTMSGGIASVTVAKPSGLHWQWSATATAESPEFEINDAGRLSTADGRVLYAFVRYRETRPGTVFRAWSVTPAQYLEWNYGAERQFANTNVDAALTWRNFWRTNLTVGHDLEGQDIRLTRGGPSMGYAPGHYGIAQLLSPAASRTQWNARAQLGSNDDGARTRRLSGGLAFRPGPRVQLSIDPAWVQQTDPRQYVATLPGGRAETFGQRYVFSFIDRTTLLAQIRLGYTFKPDLNLDLYAEPFAASGRFYGHGELLAPSSRRLRTYGRDGTTVAATAGGGLLVTDGASRFELPHADFNVRSFRSNVVLRWEWRPGSTLYAVWQRDRFGSEPLGSAVGFSDLLGSFAARGDNILALKASFWMGLR